jgi:hypothetical protein
MASCLAVYCEDERVVRVLRPPPPLPGLYHEKPGDVLLPPGDAAPTLLTTPPLSRIDAAVFLERSLSRSRVIVCDHLLRLCSLNSDSPLSHSSSARTFQSNTLIFFFFFFFL